MPENEQVLVMSIPEPAFGHIIYCLVRPSSSIPENPNQKISTGVSSIL